ncbi:MAG: trifunctional transcriptional regulator/proline dehydrogenase/L-glutamate gamma-semialdehyde dehydrogenase, partial [Rhodocyclaceae bacterium]|nr:trifunctional transcriptional regulator/proline dehydrogenase/L-glutamate gamma-semialdehyde dehydrogenase [Rhodocyclaceae bacterium]
MSRHPDPAGLAGAALPSTPRSATRVAIEDAWRRPETECVASLLSEAALDSAQRTQVASLASELVAALRSSRTRSSGVDALMKEFSLSSQEGVALMCLAEALLRVPDRATADRLIRDKLAKGDWRAHL